ncbi:MAG: hypothetical protein NVSMB10_15090 [Steroidobacteraceae bacterium]
MNAKLMPRTLLILLLALTFPAASFAYFSVGVSVGFAPPALPLYAQPPCPVPGYLWTPGYWAYSEDAADYYWVPGTWVAPPAAGLLWTPGFWALAAGAYLWNAGYWGPQVGFYGGINYGYGYFGAGFEGGYWRNNDFYYNRAVTNISNVNVTNVYNKTVLNTNYYGNRPSFNGATGVHANPTPAELSAAREPHRGISEPQRLQEAAARNLPALRASVNHGYPSIAATTRPGAFQGRDVVPAHYVNLATQPAARPPGAREPAAREPAAPAARPSPGYPQSPRSTTAGRYGSGNPPPARQAFNVSPHANVQSPHGNVQPPYANVPASRGNFQTPRSTEQARRSTHEAPRSTYRAPGNAYQPPRSAYSAAPRGNLSAPRNNFPPPRGNFQAPRNSFAVHTSPPPAGHSAGGGEHRR